MVMSQDREGLGEILGKSLPSPDAASNKQSNATVTTYTAAL